MTTPTPKALRELADRVEALTGPDRAVDWAIYESLGEPKVRLVRAATAGWDDATWAPFYTASLDAALSLVPEGWAFVVTTHCGMGAAADCYDLEGDPNHESLAATPALALVAASLRALVNQGEG